MVRLKTEHHAICVTQENLPTTNIYTHIDFNHSDLESRNGRNTLQYIKRNQNNYVQKQKQWNLLYVLFFLSVLRYEIWREKSDCFGSNKVLIHKEQKEKLRSS